MTIHDQIKEAFKKRGTAPLQEEEETKKYNEEEVSKFLKKSGYKLVDIIEHEGGISEFIISPVESSHLYPEITQDIEEGVFLIDVKKYGNLEASDVEEVIKGYQTALGVVEYMNNLI